MITLTGRRFCTVWNYRELLEEVITEPKDQETIHICNGPHNSYCRKAVYKDLPYIKTLGDDAKVCRRCVYALGEQLKAERRKL